MKQIDIDLAGPNINTGDGQVDNVTINGTAGADHYLGVARER